MSNEIAEVIQVAEERFLEINPVGLNYASEKGFAVQSLKANDFLMKTAVAQPASLQMAICNVASIGLSLSPAEKLAYLIPRKGKVCLDVSYMGFCRIATNSGSIEWIQAELVYENDAKFVNKGLGEKPDHDFDGFATLEERGNFRGGYCVAKLLSGDYLTTVMSAEKIYDVRGRSEAYKSNQSGPWSTDFEEMAKKTVVRRAFKMWPRTDQHTIEKMAIAVQLSNEAESFVPILTTPNLGEYSEEQKAHFDQLIENNNAIGMRVLQLTLDEREFANLYHSFEKGQKGKYQKVIDNLCQEGQAQLQATLDEIRGAIDHDDPVGLQQLVGDLNDDERACVSNMADDETKAIILEIQSEDKE